MRRARALAAAAALVVACALPKVEIDPSLADAGASAGTGGGMAGGSGGGAGKGGSDGAGTGQGGSSGAGTGALGGVAGAGDSDEREAVCGDYCNAYVTNCVGAEANTYDGLGDCLVTCFTSDWHLGTDPKEINSLQCRQTHAHLAATAQIPHCFHSAEFPSGTSCAPM